MTNLHGLPGLVLRRTRACWLGVAITAVLTGSLVLAIGMLARSGGIGVREITQDAAWTAGVPFYYGALGSVGVLCWWTGGVISLFASALLGRGRDAAFLRCSGLFTLLLAADDEFQLHEIVLPTYTGISETVVYGVYAALGLAYAAVFLPTILRTDFPFLFAGGACLAFSILFDVLLKDAPGQHLIEDGAKLVGIALWTVYFVRTSFAAVQGRLAPSEDAAPAPPSRREAVRLGAASRA